MALVHKYVAGQSNKELFNNFEGGRRAGTRQKAGGQDLTVQFARTDLRKYSFAERSIEGWKPSFETMNYFCSARV